MVIKTGYEIWKEYEDEVSKIISENNYYDMCKKGIKSIPIKSAKKKYKLIREK